jgi:hypothetical protein
MGARTVYDILKRRSSLTSATRTRRRAANQQPIAGRLQLEALEDRCLLSFYPPVNYAVGNNPQAIVVGDFNGDTLPDLAVANYSSADLSVLLGNADGSFQSALTSSIGASLLSLAIGDFDTDDQLDLVATDSSGRNVRVLHGNGDGTFVPDHVTTVDFNPNPLAVGDIDDDGNLDLVATFNQFTCTYYGYYGCYSGYNTGNVKVLLGNGDATFADPISQAVPDATLTNPVLQDFNGDHTLDLATTDPNFSLVRVFEGNGDGTFADPTAYPTGSNPQSLVEGDVNGDGISDLISRNYYSVSVLLGNGSGGVGDGTFQAPLDTPTGFIGYSATGDINDDGKLDLVGTSNLFTCTSYGYYGGCYSGYYTGQVQVLLGNGDGTFGTPRTTSVDGRYVTGVAAADFNRDEFLDVAVLSSPISGANSDVSVLINDQFWPSYITIGNATVTEGNSLSINASFTVRVSPPSNQAITFHYETADITATAGSDYTAASDDITIDAGVTSQTIEIPVLGDRLAEPFEYFVVTLSDPTNATLFNSQGFGFIFDNEPTVSINDVVVTEGNTGSLNVTFTVTLSAAYDETVTVHYDTANGDATAGSDYVANSADLVFLAGDTSKPISIAIIGDRVAELAEYFLVNLTTSSNAGLSDGQGVGTIIDNEPRISIDNPSVTEGTNRSVIAVFAVTLSAPYDQAITVRYATANGDATSGSDYNAASGNVTFGIGETYKPIKVSVIGDRLAETAESFSVNLTAPSNAALDNGTGYATIWDDEPRVRINNVSKKEGQAGKTSFVFTVSLSAPYDQTVSVKYATFDNTARAGSDYTATSGTLTFTPGQTTKTFTVFVKGDTTREPQEYFYILLSDASSNLFIDTTNGWGTIRNDDRRRR